MGQTKIARIRNADGFYPDGTPVNVTLQLEYVTCGKASCKRCPHGPYWRGYWTTPKGKSRSKYIGKSLPDRVKSAMRRAQPPQKSAASRTGYLPGVNP